MDLLLDNGGKAKLDINLASKDGRTALYYAVQCGNYSFFIKLVKKKAKVLQEDVLELAYEHQRFDFLIQLLQKEKQVKCNNVELLSDVVLYLLINRKQCSNHVRDLLSKLPKKGLLDSMIRKRPIPKNKNHKEDIKYVLSFQKAENDKKKKLETAAKETETEQTTEKQEEQKDEEESESEEVANAEKVENRETENQSISIIEHVISVVNTKMLSWIVSHFETFEPFHSYLSDSNLLKECITHYCGASKSEQTRWMDVLPQMIGLSGKQILNRVFGEEQRTILHIVCEAEKESVILLLSEHGVDWEMKDACGKRAIELITNRYVKEMIQKKIGADEEMEEGGSSSSRRSSRKRNKMDSSGSETPSNKRRKK